MKNHENAFKNNKNFNYCIHNHFCGYFDIITII